MFTKITYGNTTVIGLYDGECRPWRIGLPDADANHPLLAIPNNLLYPQLHMSYRDKGANQYFCCGRSASGFLWGIYRREHCR